MSEEDYSFIIPETLGVSWLREKYREKLDEKVSERIDEYFSISKRDSSDDEVLKKAIETYSVYLGKEDEEIIKAGWQLGVKRYGKEMSIAGIVGYEEWEEYVGIPREKAISVNNWIWDKVFSKKTLDLEKLKAEMVEIFKIPESQAEAIIRTEMANIFNKMREWGYLEKTDAKYFKWVAKADACEKCKRIEAMTRRGISLDELKKLIREIGGKYAREWTVHPQCRCTFVKARGRKKSWEKV